MAKTRITRNDPIHTVGLARVGILAFGTFVLGTDGYVIAGILPEIARGTRVSVALAGQLVTIFALTYAFGSPFLAVASAKIGRRRLLLGALGVFAVANLGAAFAPDYGTLAAARVLAALGAAAYTPAATVAAASLVAPERRGRALATVTAGMTMAILFGVPLGTLVGGVFGWRATFGLIAILTVIAAAGIAFWLPALPTAPVVSLRARLALLADRQVAGLLVVTVLMLTGGFSVYTYLLPLLAQAHPSPQQASLLLVAFGAGGILGNALGGISVDRFDAARTVGVGLAALTCILALFATTEQSLLASGGLLFVWGIVAWAVMPGQQHRLLGRAGQAGTAALALNGSAIYLGIALSGGVGGVLLSSAGPVVLPLTAAGLVAGSLVISVLVARKAHLT